MGIDHTRIDNVWDKYIPNCLKASAGAKRGTGTRGRVLPDSKKLLAATCITIETQCTIISAIGNLAITNGNYDLSFVAPSNQEEADTKMLLHAKDAS